ncbi:chlorophyll a/b-binding protein domain-containing protein [Baffinella frigidus]|nr:chlorophyll a/b-binding protein domain-containing protein [Cryptophyta sp. CCMP2293]|eukprot:CAMPEP_0180131998 /NCGR_PEP_ID=MMETSP0986-20121125/8738_1 /TAXON_ID=697907 /ORGANISM="non described non described, Strain CCMP2293" /LENGTH=267 /DNA_ID=CAMNT_0022071951 /DNA_START=45 /DNA_END=848 /DNA_ORIENTATION=-
MFSRTLLIAAAAFAGAEAFAPGPMLPSSSVRSGISANSLCMQAKAGKVLDGKMAGDKGFDPLGFASSVPKLRIYREAELKHGRLAMLAALGWPVAEQLNGPLSKAMGLPSLLTAGGLDPSVLNGGIAAVSPFYWLAVLSFASATELYATQMQKRAGFRATLASLGFEKLFNVDIDGDGQVGEPVALQADMDYLPGDLGFDPLGLFKGTEQQKMSMQLKEVNNGRLAMVAIVGYAIQEAATKVSILESLGVPVGDSAGAAKALWQVPL